MNSNSYEYFGHEVGRNWYPWESQDWLEMVPPNATKILSIKAFLMVSSSVYFLSPSECSVTKQVSSSPMTTICFSFFIFEKEKCRK